MNTNALEQAGKEELRDELLKIKARQKRMQDDNKQKTAATISTVATVGSATLLAYVMGGKEAEVRKEHPDFDTATQEDKKKWLSEKQAIMGIDYDALIGIIGIGVGLTDSAGEWSGPLGAIGAGALSAFAARSAYNNAALAKEEEVKS